MTPAEVRDAAVRLALEAYDRTHGPPADHAAQARREMLEVALRERMAQLAQAWAVWVEP